MNLEQRLNGNLEFVDELDIVIYYTIDFTGVKPYHIYAYYDIRFVDISCLDLFNVATT